MKKLALFCAVSVSFFLSANALAGSADAGMGVQATVQGICSATASALSFGQYDPLGPGPYSASASVDVTCSDKIQYWIELDAGLNFSAASPCPGRAMDDGNAPPNYLCYEIMDATTGMLWGSDNIGSPNDLALANGNPFPAPEIGMFVATGLMISHPAIGDLPPGQSVPPGTYNDVVTAYIDF